MMQARHPLHRDRQAGCAARRSCARNCDDVIRRTAEQSRPAAEPGDQLRRPRGNRGRGEGAGRRRARGATSRSTKRRSRRGLYTAGMPDPDLLIRTSGEMRVSNFLLWQIAYAELYVTETLWPDFTRAELLGAILDYQKRDRRFGGLGRCRAASRNRLDWSRRPFELDEAHRDRAGPDSARRLAGAGGAVVGIRRGAGRGRAAGVSRVRSDRRGARHRARGMAGNGRGPGCCCSRRSHFVIVVAGRLLAMTLALRVRDLASALPSAAVFLLGVIYIFGAWRCAIGSARDQSALADVRAAGELGGRHGGVVCRPGFRKT